MFAATVFVLHNFFNLADEIGGDGIGLIGKTQLKIQFAVGAMGLIFATIAILLRSGAVMWLIPLYWLSVVHSWFTIFLDERTFAGMLLLAIAFFMLLFIMLIFFWLVKRQEIRRP